MRKELDDLLCQRYPEIFRDRNADEMKTAMCWGFECGDGWFDLIDTLCREISEAVQAGTMPPVVAFQVKEKYGEFRFYLDDHLCGNNDTRLLIQDAEARADKTCEWCGQPGSTRNHGWLQVLCDACEAVQLKRIADRKRDQQ